MKQEHNYLPVFAVFPRNFRRVGGAIVNIKMRGTSASVPSFNELVKSTLCELPYHIVAAAFSLASGDNTRQITTQVLATRRRAAARNDDKNLGRAPDRIILYGRARRIKSRCGK